MLFDCYLKCSTVLCFDRLDSFDYLGVEQRISRQESLVVLLRGTWDELDQRLLPGNTK